MRTYIYIDGFNFYYRAIKGSQYKWLDLKAVCQRLLKPYNTIVSIKYFTAMVSELGDPQRPNRQKTYIRALKTHIPELSVHYGTFLTHQVDARLVTPVNGHRYAKIYKTQEKGSDVNLAIHLLHDAHLDKYDCAVVISNDSDLAYPLQLVKSHHNKKVGLFIPHDCHPSRELQKNVDFVQKVRPNLLAKCLLPNPIPGTTIHKPSTW